MTRIKSTEIIHQIEIINLPSSSALFTITSSSTSLKRMNVNDQQRHRRRQKLTRNRQTFIHTSSMVPLLLVLLLLFVQPLATQGLLCTSLQEKKLSTLHDLMRTSSRLLLCPFTISGDGCDIQTPFIHNNTMSFSKRVECYVTLGGECKISCEVDSHIVVKDGVQLHLISMTFEKAKKGSIHVKNGFLRSVGNIWRDNMNLINSTDVIHRGGGAIRGYSSRAILSIQSSQFWNNFASDNGGAIFSDGAVLHIIYSSFVENEAQAGGAIYSTGNRIHTTRNVFASNIAHMAPVMYFEPAVTPYLATGAIQRDLACDNKSELFECNGAFDSETDQCTTFVECDSPTSKPSQAPSKSMMPSSQPSSKPTSPPTKSPAPSQVPTAQSSSKPTSAPSISPSKRPSSMPSLRPTKSPTSPPSVLPSVDPTSIHSLKPSASFSNTPSLSPSSLPSMDPTHPTHSPSEAHSILPSLSRNPSESPSIGPTAFPSKTVSSSPSEGPTNQASPLPSMEPSEDPSFEPSAMKSSAPSVLSSEDGM